MIAYYNDDPTSTAWTGIDNDDFGSCTVTTGISWDYALDAFSGAYNLYPIPRIKRFFEATQKDNIEKQNHLFKIMIAVAFNIYAATFNRRAIFSKSGFVVRSTKRKKGKL